MNEWHLSKQVTVGQILTLLSLIGLLIVSWNDHETRLSVVETKEVNSNQVQRDIRDELIRLNNKLDRAIEKRK